MNTGYIPLPRTTPSGAQSWEAFVRWAALGVFFAVPAFCLYDPAHAGRLVWTVTIAALPLAIVLMGYHRWRRICPLSWISQLPARLGLRGLRRVPKALDNAYYYVTFSLFIISLWLRLVATNGDGRALALFFMGISLLALVTGALFTGKSWCNYFCPVLFVEKIYTEPHGLRPTANSQCKKCSACKASCPDINQENGYWKEISSSAKRFVYFAFPGVVFGFYFYYFLQSGTWDYYFSGAWTHEPGLFGNAFSAAQAPGLFFFPALPRAAAAFLTLAACGLASVALWTGVERSLPHKHPRHIAFTLAAFAAFLTFYTFAGAPTLRRLPWVFQHLFLITVVATATLFLSRRLRRTPAAFAEESLASGILKHWRWADGQRPRTYHDAALIHEVRAFDEGKEEKLFLGLYTAAVTEALADGIVSADETQLLETLRRQMGIGAGEHRAVMERLSENREKRHAVPTSQSPEKRLQMETYSAALGDYLSQAPGAGAQDESFLARLRNEYGVTLEEQGAVLNRLSDDVEARR